MPSARIAPAARDDIRDIRIYSKVAFGAATARAYLQELKATFSVILRHPSVGFGESDLGQNVRSYPHRSHRIYHVADEEGVLIVRILHHARDVPRIMGGTA